MPLPREDYDDQILSPWAGKGVKFPGYAQGVLKLQFDWYIYTLRENGEPRTHWNSAEMAKVRPKNIDKVSRRQGKAFLFD